MEVDDMQSNKFDFDVAMRLIQAVDTSASTLEKKNKELQTKFLNLRVGFNDYGYDEFSREMSASDKAIEEVLTELKAISKHIEKYAEKLKGV